MHINFCSVQVEDSPKDPLSSEGRGPVAKTKAGVEEEDGLYSAFSATDRRLQSSLSFFVDSKHDGTSVSFPL